MWALFVIKNDHCDHLDKRPVDHPKDMNESWPHVIRMMI